MDYKYYRILNLEGAWFNYDKDNNKFVFSTTENKTYKDKNGKTITIKPNKNKLYSATMPYSLETYRAFKKVDNETWYEDGEYFTKLFVNLKFKKDMFIDFSDGKTKKIKKKKVRELIYTSTIVIDGIEYCFFKRGASKARTANVILAKKKYYDLLFKSCLLGLKFDINNYYDVTSMQAYISLIMSGIIDIITINSDEILIIDDIMSPEFKAKQTVTKMDNEGNIFQDEDIFDVVNNMSDGQVLMDESVYLENKTLNKATCALLRNDFFKGNAVRTRLQEYYKENNITKVWDKYRGWMDSSKIRLAIIPSALKYLKFANQFDTEKECFLDWLDRVPNEFGLVKIDKMGNYGFANMLSYQMLNSMNLNIKEVEKLIEDELKYIKLLKDNTIATSKDIRKMNKKNKVKNRELRNEMGYFLSLVHSKNTKDTCTSDMIANLLNRNSDFRFTTKFKDFKYEQIRQYINNLRLGKIRVKNSLYAIMVSCPYEMLVATTKEDNKVEKCIMDKYEVYCPRFKDNIKLLGIRNPQINEGNIAYLTNKYHKEYKYFGYYVEGKAKHDFVVFTNSYNADIMNRLQGCDWDIDSIFLTDNELLASKAKDSQVWATPVNGIEGSKELRQYNNLELAKLDNYLGGSTMAIGKIVNKSAIFNGYMYNAINKDYSENYVNKCYEASSTLSSFSQIAIDMAKSNFNGLSLTKEMNNLNKKTYVDKEGNEKKILEFKIDKANTEEIKLKDYLKEMVKKENNKNYVCRHELADKISNIDSLLEEYKSQVKKKKIKLDKKFNKKIKVHTLKMIVPYFFKYIAKDNFYRIPTYMLCGMDYLQKILDGVDLKSIQTDKVDISDLLSMQKDLKGGAYNKDKVDKARRIIDNCNNIVNQNIGLGADSKEEKRKKGNIVMWAKKKAIRELEALKLNEKTVYRILIRAFNKDKNYKGNRLSRLDDKGNVLTYYDWDYEEEFIINVREFKEMTLLVLTLLYNSYRDKFIKCFKEKKIDYKFKNYWSIKQKS